MHDFAFLALDFTKAYTEFRMQMQLDFFRGEFFSLVGPSGCGKTTLLRLIAGLEQPDYGSIKLQGRELTTIPPAERRIGLVFQDYALFPHLNVAANIAYGLKTQHRPAAFRRQRVAELLDLFELGDLAGRNIQQLSGGEKQRVAIARALAPQPEVLLLDEPFSALDYELRRRLHGDLKKYQRLLEITTIFVTHQREEALAISDRIGVIQNGQLLQVGAPTDVYHNPANRFVAGFLGEVNLLPCEVRSVANGNERYTVHCGPQFSFQYQPSTPLLPGKYTLMVRPEDLRLTAPDQPGGTAVVAAAEFLGPSQRVKLTVGTQMLSVLTGNTERSLQPGDRVNFQVNLQMLRFLPADF
jgi:ABC-type Fe3+/spermidine/putrescine transport system ATPase subunit